MPSKIWHAPNPTAMREDAPAFRRLPLNTLVGTHRELLTRAIIRVLATDIAEETYAQIIDGLPTADVLCDTAGGLPHDDHPIHNAHDELCPGVIEKTKQFRENFRPENLQFDSRLLLAYQAASPGSRAFKSRLIEMVAVAVHQVAVLLFNMDIGLHKNDGIADWAPPREDEMYWEECPNGPPPTLFYHPWFIDYEQYPSGRADVAGYWAEARILGGVVLFDRRARGNPDDVYFHSNREDVTYRIYRLLPEQKKALLEFLTADAESSQDLLPMLGDQSNMDRVDPEEPIEETGIYRDIWERKTRPVKRSDERLRDVWDKTEFPTHTDKFNAAVRARERLRRQRIAEAMSEDTPP